jgi:hypothetical protein
MPERQSERVPLVAAGPCHPTSGLTIHRMGPSGHHKHPYQVVQEHAHSTKPSSDDLWGRLGS